MTAPLSEAIASDDPWTALELLVRRPPGGLLEAVRARYAAAEQPERRKLSWLLRLIPGPEAGALLLDLLHGAYGDDAADLLGELNRRGTSVPGGTITRFLADTRALGPAIDAAGLSCEKSLASAVAAHLDTPGVRGRAAIALGRLRSTAYTGGVTARLPLLTGLDHGAFVVALELMGDDAAIGPLREWLRRAPAGPAWELHRALSRLTGHEPLIPLDLDPAAALQAIRRAWESPSGPGRPRVGGVELGPAQARFTVENGLGRVRIGYDPPSPGSPWPAWDKSLFVAGRPVYHAGSDCGTCETTLRLIGWPDERAAVLSERLRETLRDVPAITPELVGALEPLLGGLRTGHYVLVLADLDLRRVTEPEDAWWFRRIERRDLEFGEREDDPTAQWPGTDHFQLREPIPAPVPAFAGVLPTRPLDGLAAGTVAGFDRDVAAGLRPAAVLLTWAENRHVQAESEERFLVSVVLDGHHKLAAYAGRRVPARALLVCRVEDSWGPPDDRARWLLELTGPLRAASAG